LTPEERLFLRSCDRILRVIDHIVEVMSDPRKQNDMRYKMLKDEVEAIQRDIKI